MARKPTGRPRVQMDFFSSNLPAPTGRGGHKPKSQLQRVAKLMADGRWRSLHRIHCSCGGTEASISARIRDLRKPACGRYKIERAWRGGQWEYRMVTR
jgi:hypothetical protein